MGITIEQAKVRLQFQISQSMRAAAEVINTQAEEFVPISQGTLKATLTTSDVKHTGNITEIELQAGGSSPGGGGFVKYARAQYYKKGHIMQGDKPLRILSVFSQSGGGVKARYQRAYRQAKKQNRLTKVELQWWHRAIKSEFLQRFVQNVMINIFKGEV